MSTSTHTGIMIGSLERAVDKHVKQLTRKPYVEITPKVPVGFTLSPQSYDRLQQTVLDCGTNVSEFCRVAVEAYFEKLENDAR